MRYFPLALLIAAAFFGHPGCVTAQPFTEITTALPGLRHNHAVWGDCDNDGDLDLLITGYEYLGGGHLTRIYRNNGNHNFTDLAAGLPANWEGTVAWGDYDRDGDLDVLCSGSVSGVRLFRNDPGNLFTEVPGNFPTEEARVVWADFDNDGDLDFLSVGTINEGTRFYRNNGNDEFTEAGQRLAGLEYPEAHCGDFDQDGDLDIALAGRTVITNYYRLITRIYRNEGNWEFTDIGAALEPLEWAGVAWHDFDNDGDLDLSLSGRSTNSVFTLKLYRNDGDNFVDSGIAFPGIIGSLAWGDYDHDGFADLLVCGSTSTSTGAQLFRNVNGLTFTNSGMALPQISKGFWADTDGDGDLDMLLSGTNPSGNGATHLLRNDSTSSNALPSPPQNLAVTQSGNRITLQWQPGGDANQAGGHSFNLQVGTAPGGFNIVSPQSDLASGRRRVAQPGPISGTNAWLDLPVGTYYWRVQAVDQTLAGSAFSTNASFVVPVQAPKATTQPVTTNQSGGLFITGDVNPNGAATVAWFEFGTSPSYGNTTAPQSVGGGTASVTISNALIAYQPGQAYYYRLVASNSFGVTVGAGRSIVPPAFVDFSAQLPNLGNSAGPFAWADYDNDGDLDLTGNGSVLEHSPTGFVRRLNLYPGVNVMTQSPAWADMDGDGDVDLLLVGATTRLLRNDGGALVEQPITMPGGYNPSSYSARADWVDLNQDGATDIVFLSTGPTLVYLNNQQGKFTAASNNLPELFETATAWADYDGDGDRDLAVCGLMNQTNRITRLYRNDGNGFFTDVNATLLSVKFGDLAWGDYDNDGDPDLALLGIDSTQTNLVMRLYRNDGPAGLVDSLLTFPGVAVGGLAWGDFNSDGWLDLAVSGTTSGTVFGGDETRLFQNLGNGNFATNPIILTGSYGRPVWGDFDQDGRLDLVTRNPNNFPQLFRNNIPATNPPPNPPAGLSALITNGTVWLSWNAATDANQTGGLTYNVRVGTVNGKDVAVSGMAELTNGWRRVVRDGNAGNWLSLPLTNAQWGGTYYWSVQAVDHGFAASAFAPEATFTLPAFAPQVATLTATNVTGMTALLRGEAFAGGAATTVYFEYGPSTNYGATTPAQVIGAEARWQTVVEELTNLVVGATYQYRAVVFSSAGTNFGNNQSFTTPHFVAGSSVPTPWYVKDLAAGDYDGDGDLDYVLTFTDNNRARLSRNDGTGGFTDTGVEFPYSGGEAAWADFNNDGQLDLALGAAGGSGIFPAIFRNAGNGLFVPVPVSGGLPDANAILRWGDYDQDGDVDLLACANPYPTIYRNNQTNFVALGNIFTTLAGSAGTWGDFDNDGDLDVALTGLGTGSTTGSLLIYRNNGAGTFQLSQTLPGVVAGCLVAGDLDGDGALDLMLSGALYSSYHFPGQTTIYRNFNGAFAALPVEFPPIIHGRIALGDYNNDSRLDVFLRGTEGTYSPASGYSNYARLWRNDGNMNFSDSGQVVDQMIAAWADFDNDGKLDLIRSTSVAAVLYRNQNSAANVPPTAPDGLSAIVSGNQVSLAWLAAADANQSSPLQYNVRIGSGPDLSDGLAPLAEVTNGFRRVAQIGNAQLRQNLTVRNLPGGNYFWSVQAVDHAFAGGVFSTQGVFTVTGPPTISDLTNQLTLLNTPLPPIPFQVTGLATSNTPLQITLTSSHPDLIPTNNIIIAGSGKHRTLTLTPALNQGGTATITVRVTDMFGAFVTDTFTVTVELFTALPGNFTPLWYGAGAWGDYDNDGDLDLLYHGMDYQNLRRTKLYRNNGGGSFTEVSAGLPAVSDGSVAWGDYDRDGWLDVLVAGQLSGSSGVLRVYRNTGSGTFSLVTTWSGLIAPDDAQWGDFDNDGDLDFVATGVSGSGIYRYHGGTNFVLATTLTNAPGSFGGAAWADYDLDGDLDVVVFGNIANQYYTRLYRNHGGGNFADTGISLPGIQSGDVAWGDYDNDGDVDLLLTGASSGGRITRLYRNDGNDSFTEINAGLLNLAEGAAAWGDYDNDGDLDVLLTGGVGSAHYTRVYRNEGGAFVPVNQPFINVADGAGIWGDYDNDGDLDFFVFGSLDSSTTNAARLYRNNSTTANVLPLPPAGIAAVVLGASATLQWPAGSDSNQLVGLTYNLRVGTAPGLGNVVAPMSHPTTGARRVPAPGNAGSRLSHTITNLAPGTYYASVQAVDHTFAGSVFSSETSFTITQPWVAPIPNQTAVPAQPLVVGVTVAAPGTSVDTLTLSATSSDTIAIPTGALVFGGTGTNRTLTLTPSATANGTVTVTVTATDTNGGSWSVSFQVTSELFSRLITSLDGLTNDVAVPGDFDNDGLPDLFVSELTPTGRVSRLYRNLGAGNFGDSGISLPTIERGEAVVWGDFNNDNFLDLALGGPLGGTNVIQILRNNAGNNFTRVAIIGTGTTYNSRAAWGDFDQDGDLDLVIAAAGASLLYWNNGDESFTKAELTLPAAGDYATVAAADYDQDGDLDFVLGGGSLANSWLYQNQGRGQFLPVATNFTRSFQGGLAWGDYDGDGDLDLALTGWAAGAKVWLYRNESGNNFSLVSTNLAGANQGDLAWGDGDNDGDLDLLVSAHEYWSSTRVYRNNGDQTFTDLEAGLPGLGKERVYWADLDADGDLDVIASGDTFTSLQTYRTFLYRNNTAISNTPPTAPQNLTATLLPENDVLLSWQAGSDAETTNGLSYNVRVGTTPGGIERITPEADLLTGMRRRAGFGNTGSARQLLLQNLPRGTNYWSVQTIDAAFVGSPFTAEVSFVLTNGRPELSPIADQVALPGQSTGLIPFTVNDVETHPEQLVVTATSANQAVLPDGNIQLGGAGANRSLVLTPVVNTNASTLITVVLTDSGGLSVTNVFRLSVEPFSATPIAGNPGAGTLLWGDYDNDNDLDLFVGTSVSVAAGLHRNDGGGQLVWEGAGIAAVSHTAAAWGDYDGDGDLDLVGVIAGNSTRLYRNNGNGSFTSMSPGLPVLLAPVVSWADFDNDGSLNLFLAGSTNSLATNALLRAYRLPSVGPAIELSVNLPALQLGVMAWADADNDGDLDVLLSGTATNNTTFTRLYRNEGRGDFAVAFTFPSGHRSADWNDYDQDGDMDLVLGGSTVTRVYRNEGSNVFTEVVNNLPGVADGVVAWGDYDSDGAADLLISGAGASGIYRNAGGNNFINIGAGLPGLYFSRASWGDVDGDGDLDFALLGATNQAFNYIGAVFRNNFNRPNSPPTAPAGLASTLTNGANSVVLTWSPASDVQTTNSAGLHYNLRLGTTSGADEVMPSHAAASGVRRMVALGNGSAASQWRLENLPAGTYYWSVQALDAAYAGSAFAAEASFTIANARPTLAPLQNLALAPNTLAEVICQIGDADHAAESLTVSAVSSQPTVVSNLFVFEGTGTNRTLRLPTGNIAGSATVTVTVTDPAGAYATTTFTVAVRQFSLITNAPAPALAGAQAWADYDNDGDLDLLLAGTTTTNSCTYVNLTRLYRNTGGVLTNSGLAFPGVSLSAVAWADYDRDGHLDFILAGQTNTSSSSAITRLYRNLGNGTFALTTNSFTGLAAGALAWGDYDNDGDPDLLLLGRNPSGSAFSALYRNNGTNSFTLLSTPIFGGVNVAVSWGDLDNDGDLDIVVTGGGLGTSLYRNNGNGSFASVSSSIPAFSAGVHALGDYDNDGDLDLLVAGTSGSALARVYANLGNLTFNQAFTLPGVQNASVAWGDYDNDGWRDVLLTGLTNTVSSRVFRNLGGTNFAEVNVGLVGMMAGSATWADYDRDGDLDIALAGDNGIYFCGGNGVLTALYRNENEVSNTPPTTPTNLASAVAGRNVVLTWTKSTDAQTVRSNGLSYAIRVGTNSGGGHIVSAEANATGFRQTTASGLTSTNRWRLQNLSPGTYYWSVQAIDPALAGSAFAPEAMFVITNTRPTANSQVIVLAEDSSRFFTLTGSDPDGQPLTFSLLSSPTKGSLTGTLPNLTYRPVTNFFGGDSFEFQISDGLTNSAPGTMWLVVTQVQDVAVVSLSLQTLASGAVQLQLLGEPYERHRIEASEDLRVWTLVTNLSFNIPPGLILDWDATNYPQRFYRSVWERPAVTPVGAGQLTGGQFRLMLAGEVGRVYRVEASTNLFDWQALTNLVLTNSLTPFGDGGAGQYPQRFYRFILP